jgi:hypothetical protein
LGSGQSPKDVKVQRVLGGIGDEHAEESAHERVSLDEKRMTIREWYEG